MDEMNKIQLILEKSIEEIINKTTTEKKLTKFKKDVEKNSHFIPENFRVLLSVLQSMSIKFGNFLEILIRKLIENEDDLEIVTELSGKKFTSFNFNRANNDLVDQYILNCHENFIVDVKNAFYDLRKQIIQNVKYKKINNDGTQKQKFDIDIIFRNKKTNTYYYLEIKHRDNHDTGKRMNINSKFIKTYACLVDKLNIQNVEDLVPYLYYFQGTKTVGNIYMQEWENILRGKQFFEKFLSIKYEDLLEAMNKISESKEIIKKFENLYNKLKKN